MTAVPAPEPPDVAALTAHLDAPYGDLARQVRAQLPSTTALIGREPIESRATYQALVLDALHDLIAGGNAGLGFPVEHGGGGDIGGSVVAFQNLAYSDLSLLVKAGVQFGLFGGAILHLGTERHHDRYLADLVAGRLLGCFAMTETAHGSNVHDLETTATYDPATDALVIETPTESARKDYIGNAARDGHAAVVFAQLVVGDEGRGVHAIVVPIRDAHGKVCPGVRIEDCGPKLGLNGVDNGRIWFHQVRVPRESLLNRYADVTPDGRYLSAIENPDRRFFTMIGTLVQGRVSVGGGALYASRVALATAVRYANRRRQFGPPGGVREATLMTYRTHQRRLLPLLARSYALSAAQREVVAMLHESLGADRRGSTQSELPDRRILEARAAGQKALATWFATEAIQACREACGGAGYLAENRLAALKADTDVFTTFEGDNTVLLQLVAKSLLTQFQQEFNDLDPIGLLRVVANQAVGTVVERAALRQLVERLRNAVPTRDDDAGLLDRDYHRGLFRWREEHLRAGLARRLKRGVDRGDPAFEVFARCQDHAESMARAHVERVVLEAFAASVEAADDTVRPTLDRLCDLYALAAVEADRAWFLEHGRLSSERSKATTAMVGRLCEQLAPLAEALTDAFAIPEELLGPIAARGGDAGRDG